MDSKVSKTLGSVVRSLAKTLDKKEKQQAVALSLSREVVRDCARAIRHLHTGHKQEAVSEMNSLHLKVKKLKQVGNQVPQIIDTALQEYAEIVILYAIMEKKQIPTPQQLGLPVSTYLSGFLDASGELRRELQLSLKDRNKEAAEYYFQAMNDIYNEIMLLKYSASLVGNLKRKQDVLRGQLEHARSEMLRAM